MYLMKDIIPLIPVENYDDTENFVDKYSTKKIILSCNTKPKIFVEIVSKIKEKYPTISIGINYPDINDELIFFYMPKDLPDFIYTNNLNFNLKTELISLNYYGKHFCKMYVTKKFDNILENTKNNVDYLSICPLKNNDTIDFDSLYYLYKNTEIYCELFSLKNYKLLEKKIDKYIIDFTYYKKDVEELYRDYFS